MADQPHHVYKDPKEIRFKHVDLIGHGAQGSVDSVERDGKLYARKTFVLSRTPKPHELARVIQETAITTRLKHDHIIRLVETYEHKNRYAIVMEPVAEGNLATYLDDLDQVSLGQDLGRREQLAQWFCCLIDAVAYLHESGVLHKDIKPQNILTSKNNILLTDFGVSDDFHEATMSGSTVVVGTRTYRSPERERGRRSGRREDIFSLGAVFLEMVSVHAEEGGLSRLQDFIGGPYCLHTDRVEEWIRRFLSHHSQTCSFWYGAMLSLCGLMLETERENRPYAHELQNLWACHAFEQGYVTSWLPLPECACCLRMLRDRQDLARELQRGALNDIQNIYLVWCSRVIGSLFFFKRSALIHKSWHVILHSIGDERQQSSTDMKVEKWATIGTQFYKQRTPAYWSSAPLLSSERKEQILGTNLAKKALVSNLLLNLETQLDVILNGLTWIPSSAAVRTVANTLKRPKYREHSEAFQLLAETLIRRACREPSLPRRYAELCTIFSNLLGMVLVPMGEDMVRMRFHTFVLRTCNKMFSQQCDKFKVEHDALTPGFLDEFINLVQFMCKLIDSNGGAENFDLILWPWRQLIDFNARPCATLVKAAGRFILTAGISLSEGTLWTSDGTPVNMWSIFPYVRFCASQVLDQTSQEEIAQFLTMHHASLDKEFFCPMVACAHSIENLWLRPFPNFISTLVHVLDTHIAPAFPY